MKPSSSEKTTFSNKVEQRAVIKFCVDIGKTPTEMHKFIKRSVTHSNVSRSLVFKWHKRFSDGRGSIMDVQREGRPSFKFPMKKVSSSRFENWTPQPSESTSD
jgi:transposase